ncbi:uncharacterized protein PITG_18608 [Phytophthora infestans T30-4]|uniref:Uncharacterized protein n=1 Tax=Phytophthora infestans (strain T30-4) TaxID=403677 RepID=D0NYP0_PHYIT|nr:uncharacterized protein PITG_18608 [Phytophthora infestans T30-4]EEY68664.1 conserved hypothetical protein [Phytophthora infestans T30-4]|eukprot:XP_002997534.1 conserved hypothetical protein [Phytophthora infestans T30-4]
MVALNCGAVPCGKCRSSVTDRFTSFISGICVRGESKSNTSLPFLGTASAPGANGAGGSHSIAESGFIHVVDIFRLVKVGQILWSLTAECYFDGISSASFAREFPARKLCLRFPSVHPP